MKVYPTVRVPMKKYPQNLAFLIAGIPELFSCKVCEIFVNKHIWTVEYVKKKPTFSEKNKVYRWITIELWGSGTRNFQGIIFI